MTIKFFYRLAVVIILAGCGPWSEEIKLHFNTLNVKVISPYGCYQEINLSKSGLGEFLQGLPTTSIRSDQFEFDTIYSKSSFLINKKYQSDTINLIISRIIKKSFFGGYKNDGYRIIVTVDGKEYYDAFGHSELTHKLVDFLDKFLADQRNFCEYFSTFHPTE